METTKKNVVKINKHKTHLSQLTPKTSSPSILKQRQNDGNEDSSDGWLINIEGRCPWDLVLYSMDTSKVELRS